MNLVVVDPRKGLSSGKEQSDEEHVADSNFLTVCLSEISKCDVFVGLLGQHLGPVGDRLTANVDEAIRNGFKWLEGCRDRSLLELELQCVQQQPEGNGAAVVFLRDEEWDAAQYEATGSQEYVVDGELKPAATALRKRLLDMGCSGKVRAMTYAEPGEVSDRVDQLFRALRRQIASLCGWKALADAATSHHRSFMLARHAESVGGYEHLLTTLDQFAAEPWAPLLCVLGPPGSGKTTFLSSWVLRREAAQHASRKAAAAAQLQAAADAAASAVDAASGKRAKREAKRVAEAAAAAAADGVRGGKGDLDLDALNGRAGSEGGEALFVHFCGCSQGSKSGLALLHRLHRFLARLYQQAKRAGRLKCIPMNVPIPGRRQVRGRRGTACTHARVVASVEGVLSCCARYPSRRFVLPWFMLLMLLCCALPFGAVAGQEARRVQHH